MRYTEEFKLAVIKEVQNGTPKIEVERKYDIKGHNCINHWMKKYSTVSQPIQVEQKSTHNVRDKYTDEFKKGVILDMVNNNLNVNQVATKYDLETPRIYQWNQKYNPNYVPKEKKSIDTSLSSVSEMVNDIALINTLEQKKLEIDKQLYDVYSRLINGTTILDLAKGLKKKFRTLKKEVK